MRYHKEIKRSLSMLTIGLLLLSTVSTVSADDGNTPVDTPEAENQTAGEVVEVDITVESTLSPEQIEGEEPEEAPLEEVATEAPIANPEEFQELVGTLAEEEAILVDASGEKIAMGSEIAAEALKGQDPWFEANDGSGVIGYCLDEGSGCTCALVVPAANCNQVTNPVQAAVDDPLSENKTITIDGVYKEQVRIVGKNVTLAAGPGGGGLAANGEILESSTDLYGLLYVENAHVNILGLTFDGSGGFINGSVFDNFYSAIVYNMGKGVIQDVVINNFEDTNVFDDGVGIYLKDSDGVLVDISTVSNIETDAIIIENSSNVQVDESVVSNAGNNAIEIRGSNNVHITNNTISNFWWYGVNVGAGSSDVYVIKNLIDGIAGVGVPQQSGIHVDAANASLQCNTLSNNRDQGIFIENTNNVEVLYNTFTANNEKAIYTRNAGTSEAPLIVNFNNIYKAPGASWTIWGYKSIIDATENYWNGAAPTGVVRSLSTILDTPFSLIPFSSEECDACEVISFCGDRLVTGPEECDDGNTEDGDGCSAQCTIEVCGNNRIDFGETCDGQAMPQDAPLGAICSDTCVMLVPELSMGSCINGPNGDWDVWFVGKNAPGEWQVVGYGGGGTFSFSIGVGETIYDSTPNAATWVKKFCLGGTCVNRSGTHVTAKDQWPKWACAGASYCGDGYVMGNEECDDGNSVDGDGCSAKCTIENFPSPPVPFTPLSIPVTGGMGILAAGLGHTCALSDARGLECWGLNDAGQLGDGSNENQSTPVDVVGLDAADVLDIKAGQKHTCALTGAGEVFCWGLNNSGQLGDGTTDNRNKPVQVQGLEGTIISISTGANFSCAINSGGEIFCWGENTSGELNDGTNENRTTAVRASEVSDALLVSGGVGVLQGIATDGSLQFWSDDPFIPVTGLPKDGNFFVAADRFTDGGCSLTNAGEVFCWGGIVNAGISGALVEDMLVSGAGHACTLKPEGLVCWGNNGSGQLGDGSTDDSKEEVLVQGLDLSIISLAAGERHTCAMMEDETVMCWGDNGFGQLGNGSTTNSKLPMKVQ